MRIVNIIHRYPPAVGGAETWCQEVGRHLAKKGHVVKVLTLDVNKEEEYWRDPLDDECMLAFGRLAFDEGITVRRYHRSLPIHSLYHLVYKRLLDHLLKIYFYGPHSGEMYGRMWREIKRADVVFLHTVPHPHNFVAFAVAKLLGKRIAIIPHFHPTHPYYERKSLYWLLRQCDVVMTVTDFEKQYLNGRGIPNEKLFVTGNGIHPEEYQPVNLVAFQAGLETKYNLTPEDKLITFIGRKTQEKGVGHLIAAVKDLLAEMPLKLFLVGPSFDWYKELYAGLSAEERQHIIDLGVLSHQDKVNLLHVSDLLVLPSQYEAFGIVFLEAWVCGVPVLGTTEGAMPSVIGDCGFLCQFGDTEDLKSKIKDAIANREVLRTLGSRGKTKVVAQYTWDVIGMKAERALKAASGRGKDGLRVIFVSNAYPPYFVGGAELIAHAQAKCLKARGHEVIVFAGEPNDRGARHSLRQDYYEGLPVYRVCLHRQDYSAEFMNFYHESVHRLFDDLLEELAPDVVHFHNLIGLSASLIRVAKRRRIKTVLTLHDHWGICLKNTLIKQAGEICDDFTKCAECLPSVSEDPWQGVPVRLRSDFVAWQLQAVDTFISPSRYLADTYARAGIAREKIHVVWYGIDLDRFGNVSPRKDNEKVRFSFVGYLGHHKGVATLLDALPLLGEKERVTINIVGDGEDRANYEGKVRALGWNGAVQFWGRVDHAHIERVYRETDVLLLPSLWPENQPISITEAMAARIPVIASRMGGIPEVVEDGKTGFLFEAGDASELAQKMSVFIADRGKVVELGENAFRRIQEDSLDNQVEKLIALYSNGGQRTTVGDPPTQNPLIVCVGNKIHPRCTEALRIFLTESNQQCSVVMCDWLEESQIREAKMLWVVDEGVKMEEVLIGLRNHLPLLVPENNTELRDLCVYGKCGLYYRDAFEAVGCLRFLLQQERTREIMGQNGFKLFYSEAWTASR